MGATLKLSNVVGCVFAVWILGAETADVLAQGPLSPSGVPAPTMKTLDQVEPRTPISSLPVTITQPGSYYVVSNLTGTSGASGGIRIQSDNVSIDLNGFTLYGGSANTPGIHVPFNRENITIRNGVIRDWRQVGVDARAAHQSLLEDLKAYSNGLVIANAGLRIGRNSTVRRCQSMGNGREGIIARQGSLVFQSMVFMNGTTGITTEADSKVLECEAKLNGQDGISVAENCLISACSTSSNGNHGVVIKGGSLLLSVSRGNQGCGFVLGSPSAPEAGDSVLMEDGLAEFNGLDGIRVFGRALVKRNASQNNGAVGLGAGVYAPGPGGTNRIEGNNLSYNDFGIRLDSTGNIVIRNSLTANATNIEFVAGNSIGELIDVAALGLFTNSNPWANLTY